MEEADLRDKRQSRGGETMKAWGASVTSDTSPTPVGDGFPAAFNEKQKEARWLWMHLAPDTQVGLHG